jgi:hypothetical protein
MRVDISDAFGNYRCSKNWKVIPCFDADIKHPFCVSIIQGNVKVSIIEQETLRLLHGRRYMHATISRGGTGSE